MSEVSAATAETVAGRLADYVVLIHDPNVPELAPDYFDESEPHYTAVNAATTELIAGDPAATAARAALAADWSGHGARAELIAQLVRLLGDAPDKVATLGALIDEADRRLRIDVVYGAVATPADAPPVEVDRLAELLRAAPRAVPSDRPQIQVIIPFRDASGRDRLRNLLSCLLALHDQEPAPDMWVTVIETDERPRWRDLLTPLVDSYLFAPKGGLFNKSWAVNVAVTNDGRDAPLVCVLDADVIADRSFIARNAGRFADGSQDAHLPYRRAWCLDEPTSRRAIAARCVQGLPDVPEEVVRALVLVGPPGHCMWVTREAYLKVNGFDERFEGWGGEDDDVVARLARDARLVRHDDRLLHLDHLRPAMVREDGINFNKHLSALLDWQPEGRIGDPDRFAHTVPAGS
ncbi:hypothetical protein Daura_15870 [Dactylosporangium aurantiacum]|uniref:Galactosyltransferase C-terminal domain-containing protein n=1 Tax=Dactylosporangium aurantiacum TaxID=35754 RepID=A0A9Q9IKZ9_9ACTN|nr:galactosyltransferase-related protein [Dactylosporangium aurantiacum]MDG6102982.1 galactosyltransferase-related protein [Dactylosporangium aurantiacum]UWZ57496.1 hypothetical protein Daura_15870 [Dactylosporangium aurantiacum]